MSRSLDRSLDEILAERKQSSKGPRASRGNGNSNGGRRRDRQDYPRDGVRKSFRDREPSYRDRDRDDGPRNMDSEWVHDKYEDNDSRREPRRGYRSGSPSSNSRSSKVRVDNLYYELVQEDLEELFSRIGPLVKLEMKYDRAGRSEGTAFVTYESARDAEQAIREFDGANAAGQQIRLTLMPAGPSGHSGPRRNPFDNAVRPGRSLAERITLPGGRRPRSASPTRQSDEEAARRGVDRYRPGGNDDSRSRSPAPNRRREGGRRPGARRDGGGRGRRGGGGGGDRAERTGRDGRPKKTQEELDAEMADYFNAAGAQQGDSSAAANGASASVEDEMDMIE